MYNHESENLDKCVEDKIGQPHVLGYKFAHAMKEGLYHRRKQGNGRKSLLRLYLFIYFFVIELKILIPMVDFVAQCY